MTETKTLLLDTMVVGGIFAVNKIGPNIEPNKIEWKRAVNKLVKIGNCKLVLVPPSVCFELMCWSKEWHNWVSNKSHPIFNFSDEPIRNDILQKAANYSYKCGEKFGDEDGIKYKLKSMDPITAAYAIEHKYLILTENEKDFPESFFHIIGQEEMVLYGNNAKKYRRFLYILEPNK